MHWFPSVCVVVVSKSAAKHYTSEEENFCGVIFTVIFSTFAQSVICMSKILRMMALWFTSYDVASGECHGLDLTHEAYEIFQSEKAYEISQSEIPHDKI